jgi:hypothetical protein
VPVAYAGLHNLRAIATTEPRALHTADHLTKLSLRTTTAPTPVRWLSTIPDDCPKLVVIEGLPPIKNDLRELRMLQNLHHVHLDTQCDLLLVIIAACGCT